MVEPAENIGQRKPLVFISHRHADERAASVVAERLDRIGAVDVFLTSSPGFETTRAGKSINKELRNALGSASMVILIYSTPDADWSWCMYECGVATDPNDDVPTSIVTISLHGGKPRQFGDALVVPAADEDAVLQFINELCTEPNFFPEMGQPLTTHSALNGFVREQAELLFSELSPFTSTEVVNEKARWGGFSVTLDPGPVETLRALDKPPAGEFIDELMSASHVSRPRGWGLEHFGYTSLEQMLTCADLRARWDSFRGSGRISNRPWHAVMAEEFWRIVTSRPTDLTWEPFLSMKDGMENLWVYPIIYQYRSRSTGLYEFDLLVIQTLAPSVGSDAE